MPVWKKPFKRPCWNWIEKEKDALTCVHNLRHLFPPSLSYIFTQIVICLLNTRSNAYPQHSTYAIFTFLKCLYIYDLLTVANTNISRNTNTKTVVNRKTNTDTVANRITNTTTHYATKPPWPSDFTKNSCTFCKEKRPFSYFSRFRWLDQQIHIQHFHFESPRMIFKLLLLISLSENT